jgi:hypothetical protein
MMPTKRNLVSLCASTAALLAFAPDTPQPTTALLAFPHRSPSSTEQLFKTMLERWTLNRNANLTPHIENLQAMHKNGVSPKEARVAGIAAMGGDAEEVDARREQTYGTPGGASSESTRGPSLHRHQKAH